MVPHRFSCLGLGDIDERQSNCIREIKDLKVTAPDCTAVNISSDDLEVLFWQVNGFFCLIYAHNSKATSLYIVKQSTHKVI